MSNEEELSTQPDSTGVGTKLQIISDDQLDQVEGGNGSEHAPPNSPTRNKKDSQTAFNHAVAAAGASVAPGAAPVGAPNHTVPAPHNATPPNHTTPGSPGSTHPATGAGSHTSPGISKPAGPMAPHPAHEGASGQSHGNDPLRPHENKPDPFKPHDGKPDPLKPHENKPDPFKPHDSKPDPLKPHENKPDPTKPHDHRADPARPHDSQPPHAGPHPNRPEPPKPHVNYPNDHIAPPTPRTHEQSVAAAQAQRQALAEFKKENPSLVDKLLDVYHRVIGKPQPPPHFNNPSALPPHLQKLMAENGNDYKAAMHTKLGDLDRELLRATYDKNYYREPLMGYTSYEKFLHTHGEDARYGDLKSLSPSDRLLYLSHYGKQSAADAAAIAELQRANALQAQQQHHSSELRETRQEIRQLTSANGQVLDNTFDLLLRSKDHTLDDADDDV